MSVCVCVYVYLGVCVHLSICLSVCLYASDYLLMNQGKSNVELISNGRDPSNRVRWVATELGG